MIDDAFRLTIDKVFPNPKDQQLGKGGMKNSNTFKSFTKSKPR